MSCPNRDAETRRSFGLILTSEIIGLWFVWPFPVLFWLRVTLIVAIAVILAYQPSRVTIELFDHRIDTSVGVLVLVVALISVAATLGRNASATDSCTSRVSAALQTPGRWHLAFTMIRAAMSRSAAASTYTWQLPV